MTSLSRLHFAYSTAASTAPVLEVQQFLVDLLNIDVGPGNIVVAADFLQHVVVQVVEFLQQVEFLTNPLQICAHRAPHENKCGMKTG